MTETSNPRLIDANALKEVIESLTGVPKYFNRRVIAKIDSAPTVETTDDVLERIIDPMGDDESVSIWFNEEDELTESGFCAVNGNKKHFGKGNTISKALKKLEASLNQK